LLAAVVVVVALVVAASVVVAVDDVVVVDSSAMSIFCCSIKFNSLKYTSKLKMIYSLSRKQAYKPYPFNKSIKESNNVTKALLLLWPLL
jgi:hypothetical protein